MKKFKTPKVKQIISILQNPEAKIKLKMIRITSRTQINRQITNRKRRATKKRS